jgi:ribosome-associated protein
MKNFYITTEYIELVRLLKATYAFPTEEIVKQSITDGLVTVDGEVETRRKCKIRTGELVVAGSLEIRVKVGR